MSKVISHTKLTETLAISECRDGFWLYDKTRGMNLAMRAKTETDAFVEAITYYQKRLKEFETAYWSLKGKVDDFVGNFVDTSEDCE